MLLPGVANSNRIIIEKRVPIILQMQQKLNIESQYLYDSLKKKT
jgi:hypothetical protein